jgi:nicotinamide riboside kinase
MRIAFTGPESSGKTTFSKWLNEQLQDSSLHLEFAREYLEQNGILECSEDHFREIVKQQCSIFQSSSVHTNDVFDTDIFVLRIWNEEVFKLKLPELELNDAISMDIHFLCAPDIAWEADPLRSAPDQNERNRLFEKYKTELIQSQSHFIVLSGNMEEKKSLILSSIQSLLSK